MQIEHCRMGKAWAESAIERRIDLRKQIANTVAGLSDLSTEVVIEAARHGEFGDLLVGQSSRQRQRG